MGNIDECLSSFPVGQAFKSGNTVFGYHIVDSTAMAAHYGSRIKSRLDTGMNFPWRSDNVEVRQIKPLPPREYQAPRM